MKIESGGSGLGPGGSTLASRQSVTTAGSARSQLLSELAGAPRASAAVAGGGQNLAVSNIQQELAQVEAGLAAVLEVRQKQLALVEQSDALPDVTTQRSVLQAEYEALGDEFRRITGAIPSPVSQGGSSSYSYTDTDKAVSFVVNIPAPDLSNSGSTLSLEDGSLDDSNVDTLNSIIYNLGQSNRAVYSAQSAAAGLTELSNRPDINPDPDSQPKLSISEAQRLSKEIAGKIGAGSKNQESARDLIELSSKALDPDKVRALLE